MQEILLLFDSGLSEQYLKNESASIYKTAIVDGDSKF